MEEKPKNKIADALKNKLNRGYKQINVKQSNTKRNKIQISNTNKRTQNRGS